MEDAHAGQRARPKSEPKKSAAAIGPRQEEERVWGVVQFQCEPLLPDFAVPATEGIEQR